MKHHMELEELEELRYLNELDLLIKMLDIAEEAQDDAERVVKNNKQAGTRLRKKMQDVRLISEVIRNRIQNRKETGSNLKDRLEKAIQEEKNRIEKEKKKYGDDL